MPAGLIQTLAGAFVANNTIKTVSLTEAGEAPESQAAALAEYVNGACSPCNLLKTAPVITQRNVAIDNGVLVMLPVSSVTIRRMKYTPYSAAAALLATTQANSWASSTAPSAVPYGSAPAVVTPPAAKPVPASGTAFAATCTVSLGGISTTQFVDATFEAGIATCTKVPVANISVTSSKATVDPVSTTAKSAGTAAADEAVEVIFDIYLASAAAVLDASGLLKTCTIPADLSATKATSWTVTSCDSATASAPVAKPATKTPVTYPAGATPYKVFVSAVLGGVTSTNFKDSNFTSSFALAVGVPASAVHIVTKTDTAARRLLSSAPTPALSVNITIDAVSNSGTGVGAAPLIASALSTDLTAAALNVNGYSDVTTVAVSKPIILAAADPLPGSTGSTGTTSSGSPTVSLNSNKQMQIATIVIVALLFGLFLISALIRLVSSSGSSRVAPVQKGEEYGAGAYKMANSRRRMLVGTSFLKGAAV